MLALEADRARQFYAAGDALIPYITEDSQPALWVLIHIYRRLLEKIAEKQYDVFTARVSLSTWEKLRILAKGFLPPHVMDLSDLGHSTTTPLPVIPTVRSERSGGPAFRSAPKQRSRIFSPDPLFTQNLHTN